MISEIDFITKVEAHEILYKVNKRSKNKRAVDQHRKELWTQIAQECGFENANAAQEFWQQLLTEYLEYLRHGSDFPAANKMQFMQMSLLQSTDAYAEMLSDSDLDERELERILNTDTEQASLPAKRSRTVGKEGEKSKREADVKSPKEATAVPAVASKPDPGTSNFSNLSSMELIFLGYAKVLEKMPRALQLQTKRKIAEIMDEAEMQLYEQK